MKFLHDDKKGESNGIFFVILSFVFIISISAFMDLTSILQKYNSISQTMTYVARVTSEQGGLENAAPSYYASNYITKAEMMENIKLSMNYAGIKDSQWNFTIFTQDTSSKASQSSVDSGSELLTTFDTSRYELDTSNDFLKKLETVTNDDLSSKTIYHQYNMKTNTPVTTVDWGTQMAFQLAVAYEWDLTSNFIPATTVKQTIVSTRFMNSSITIQDGYEEENQNGSSSDSIKIIYD